MPPRKEPKETVVYPASKRKAPPFKPLRPSKVPRIPTTESESSSKAQRKTTSAPARRQEVAQENEEDGSEDDAAGPANNDSDEELDENPLTARSTKPRKPAKSRGPKRKPPRQLSPMSVSTQKSSDTLPGNDASASAPPLTQTNDIPAIPQPLLVRLLHEHFANKDTKIDKHAMQVLEKYFEVFVREAIARASLRKKEDAEQEDGTSAVDVGWLELEDLEKVAAGMMLDF